MALFSCVFGCCGSGDVLYSNTYIINDAITISTIDKILYLRNINPERAISTPAMIIAAVVWCKIYVVTSIVTISKHLINWLVVKAVNCGNVADGMCFIAHNYGMRLCPSCHETHTGQQLTIGNAGC